MTKCKLGLRESFRSWISNSVKTSHSSTNLTTLWNFSIWFKVSSRGSSRTSSKSRKRMRTRVSSLLKILWTTSPQKIFSLKILELGHSLALLRLKRKKKRGKTRQGKLRTKFCRETFCWEKEQRMKKSSIKWWTLTWKNKERTSKVGETKT